MKKWSVFALWFASFNTFASSSDFSWHGYISQGVTQSKDSSFITDNDDVTGELTEIGLNGYYQLAENISIAGQINYLDGGNRFEQVGHGFLRWMSSSHFRDLLGHLPLLDAKGVLVINLGKRPQLGLGLTGQRSSATSGPELGAHCAAG